MHFPSHAQRFIPFSTCRSVKRLLCDAGRPNGATFSRSQSAALLRDFKTLRAQIAHLNASSTADSESNQGVERYSLAGSFDTAGAAAGTAAAGTATPVRASSFTDTAPSTPTAAHSKLPRKLSNEEVSDGVTGGVSYGSSSSEGSLSSSRARPGVDSTSTFPATHTSRQPQLASPLDWIGTNGRTALMEAAHEGRDEALAWLLAAGATPSIRTPKGMTALHYAAKQVLE